MNADTHDTNKSSERQFSNKAFLFQCYPSGALQWCPIVVVRLCLEHPPREGHRGNVMYATDIYERHL